MSEASGLVVDPSGVQRILAEVRARPIIARILARLERELPKNLLYHAVAHTEDVLAEAVLFALRGRLSTEDLELLTIAAAYHDAGYIDRYVDNEIIGARMARAAMEAERFSGEQIATVERMVLDTRLVKTGSGARQIATSGLSKYLLDADLSNFGRPDFFEKGELQRRELGIDRERFLRRTFALVSSHSWHTEAARELRQPTKEVNVRTLGGLLRESIEVITARRPGSTLSTERLAFLARLPLLLNSSLDTRMVLTVALRHLKEVLAAEAATIFTLDESKSEVTFWALEGGASGALAGRKMSARKGIVGWVIERQEAVLVEDAQTDGRFFGEFDREGTFRTRGVMCTPLVVRGEDAIGAIQVLNRLGGGTFDGNDLTFLEQFGHQVALALDNAALFERMSERAVSLERIERERTNALTIVATEIREPLNVVATVAEALSRDEPLEPGMRQMMLATLRRSILRLSRVVSEVGAAADVAWRSTPATSDDAAWGRVDIARLVGDIQRFFAPICAARMLTLNVGPVPQCSGVRGDAGLLFVALKSLISNAIQHTPDGGVIGLTVGVQGGRVEFAVQDTGAGISAERQRTIFEPVLAPRDSVEGVPTGYEFGAVGLGLGLSTAQAVARRHGGSLRVVSDVGRGSCFTLQVPVDDGGP